MAQIGDSVRRVGEMGRPRGAAGHRTEVLGVRLTPKEAERLVDSRRGSMSRSQYLRWVLVKDADRDPHGNGEALQMAEEGLE
jgi:hypothetical protein